MRRHYGLWPEAFCSLRFPEWVITGLPSCQGLKVWILPQSWAETPLSEFRWTQRLYEALQLRDSERPLTTDLSAYAPLDAEINKLEKQLADKRNQREQLCIATWDKVKRVRASVRGIYGDDSTQYELVGGTRLSDRKPRARRVLTTE
jgi:hypothetical protein